jgi:hypothetical protein
VSEQLRPGAFYGANVQGAERPAKGGDDRPSGSPRRMERTMNIPGARQIPVEGAVTGPNAPSVDVDVVYGQADLDDLDDLTGPR